jgi:hypothetical protein
LIAGVLQQPDRKGGQVFAYKRQKAKGKNEESGLKSACSFLFLPFAFCLLPFAF